MVAALSAVDGAIILNTPRTFDSDVDGWVTDIPGSGPSDDTVTISHVATGGNPDGYMQITFNYSGPPVLLNPTISNTTDAYTGDYTIAEAISFDFIALDVAPTAGSAVFLVTSTGGTWTSAFSYLGSQVGTWVNYVIPLTAAYWSGGIGDFETAIGPNTVTAAGLDLGGGLVDGARFGIDNWQYTIPEPRTYFMLAAALLGLATTFRRPIQDAFANLKKREATRS